MLYKLKILPKMYPHTDIILESGSTRHSRVIGAPSLHSEEDEYSDVSAAVVHVDGQTKAICGNLRYSLENQSTVLITILSNARHFCKLQLRLLSTRRLRFRKGYVQTKTKTTTSRDKQQFRAGRRKRDGRHERESRDVSTASASRWLDSMR